VTFQLPSNYLCVGPPYNPHRVGTSPTRLEPGRRPTRKGAFG
jgi:hypothetical protein